MSNECTGKTKPKKKKWIAPTSTTSIKQSIWLNGRALFHPQAIHDFYIVLFTSNTLRLSIHYIILSLFRFLRNAVRMHVSAIIIRSRFFFFLSMSFSWMFLYLCLTLINNVLCESVAACHSFVFGYNNSHNKATLFISTSFSILLTVHFHLLFMFTMEHVESRSLLA